MVENTRRLERALGSGDKFVAENEKETAVVQRRCLRAAREERGDPHPRDIDVLRPAPVEAIMPFDLEKVIGKRVMVDLVQGQELR